MTTPVKSGLGPSSPVSNAIPTQEPKSVGSSSISKPKLPQFLECATGPRMELFRRLQQAGIVNNQGKLQGEYATSKEAGFPELTEDEVAVLRKKLSTPLPSGNSTEDLVTLFCQKQATHGVNLIGSYVFYFLLHELPSYRKRLFHDFPSDIFEENILN